MATLTNTIPEKTIERLSEYRRTLLASHRQGITHIFSHVLAGIHGITAVQVRRDLMLIGFSSDTKKGYDVLLFTEDVDEFVPQTLMTYMEKPFCNVSTEDLGLQTEEEKKQAEEKAEEMKGLLTFVKETLGDRVKEVKLSSELGSHPVCMTPAEGISFEMEKYMKRANPEFAFPVGRVLELNPEHEAVQAMQKAMTEDPEKAKDYAKLLCYQAQLMAELPLDDPYAYTELVCRLMK